MSSDNSANEARHWAKTRNLTIWILVVWFIFSFVVHLFAKGLNGMSFIGFPVGYYFAVQGSLIIFVALIVVQNLLQDKIDDEAGLRGE
ncbi:MAG: DUF4212 domain-containing protein [Albidovulum sp.]|nr:DUF4212 domain-containing protein [Albidovulum sp.]MDE0304522.1 DUF4212 domain-containing protein [Albidovulum sp.]MDE0531427.1 DUF4212 domain-containing protein [Albidovulum sp.]